MPFGAMSDVTGMVSWLSPSIQRFSNRMRQSRKREAAQLHRRLSATSRRNFEPITQPDSLLAQRVRWFAWNLSQQQRAVFPFRFRRELTHSLET